MSDKRRWIAYYRVSTKAQGASGLGLAAQKTAVAAFLAGKVSVDEVPFFVAIESGRACDRPQFKQACSLARLTGSTLIVAKLDRLARDAHFLLGLQKEGIEFVAADMPAANRLTVGIMAMVAEEEGRMISARTTAALAAAKAHGVVLGGDKGNLTKDSVKGRAISLASRRAAADRFVRDLASPVAAARAAGAGSLRLMADWLNAHEISTPRGGAWSATAVCHLLKRAKALA